MQNLNQLLKVLLEAKIDFVLIGGYAGVVYGSTQLTRDLHICMYLNDDDLKTLQQALKDKIVLEELYAIKKENT